MTDDHPPPGPRAAPDLSPHRKAKGLLAASALAVGAGLTVLWGVLGTTVDRKGLVGWSVSTMLVVLLVAGALLTRRATAQPEGDHATDPSGRDPDPAPEVAREDRVLPRWLALVLLIPPAAYFGASAGLSTGSIVQLELAGSGGVAAGLDVDVSDLRWALGYDVLFIAAYVALLLLLARWAGAHYRLGGVRNARIAVGWAVVAAGALDVIEDIALLCGSGLAPEGAGFWWAAAAVAAWSKFVLLLVAVVYVLGGIHTWWCTPPWVRDVAWRLSRWDATLAVAEPTGAPADDAGASVLGIALSGGGVRASSLSLGALQVLELGFPPGRGLGWARARTVTAISGGSNMAAGWSIARSWYDTGSHGFPGRTMPPPDDLPWTHRGADMSPEEANLFDNLGYLASSSPRGAASDASARPAGSAGPVAATPGQSRDSRPPAFLPTAYATVFTGLVVNAAVLLSSLWLVATASGWVLQGLQGGRLSRPDYDALVQSHRTWVPGLFMLILGTATLMLWVVLGQWMIRDAGSRPARRRLLRGAMLAAYALLGLGVALLALLWGLPELAGWTAHRGVQSGLGALAGSAGVLGAVAQILRKPVARFAPVVGGLAFGLLVVVLASYWTARSASKDLVLVADGDPHAQSGALWLLLLAAMLALQATVSPEKWSLAAFYRGKLRVPYATYRETVDAGTQQQSVVLASYVNDNTTSAAGRTEPGLHQFRADGRATTPLVVCAAATTSSRAVRTHYGIPALSVTFDPCHVVVNVPQSDLGSYRTYRAETEVMNALGQRRGKRLTTMLAVAIASAAVSPAMGRVRVGPSRMLLAFANIRLGVWMPNPRYAQNLTRTASAGDLPEIAYPRTGLGYLFKEFFGVHDMTDAFVYMTDGGHWENTGIVEMLRRPAIRELVCIDADSGALDATSSLGKAMDLAPLECGVTIRANLDPLRARLGGTRAPDYAERSVTVGFFQERGAGTGTGVLWYAKPALTRDMPSALLGFRETHHDFPTVSTVDQFFDSSTYVAYRELGRHNAHQILRARRRLVELLELLDLAAASEEAALQQLDRAATQTDPAPHWVAGDLLLAAQLLPEGQRLEFLRSVNATLALTPVG